MQVKKHGNKVYGAVFTAAEKKAVELEVKRQLLEANQQFFSDVDATILYTLKEHLGFGKKRLRQFYDAFHAERDNMVKHYEMPDDYPWLCKTMLKRIGVDLEAWEQERREENVQSNIHAASGRDADSKHAGDETA